MADIADILKSVPEVKLKIIPLTWQLVGKNGHIDIKKASYNAKEVDGALEEAASYAKSAESAASHLKNLLRK
ncbi:MAG: hypothetical protein Q8O55_01640 [Dehalococcoidales bacterium]|nr:hypothetical protein [Dehalococcoidales bacterium]